MSAALVRKRAAADDTESTSRDHSVADIQPITARYRTRSVFWPTVQTVALMLQCCVRLSSICRL